MENAVDALKMAFAIIVFVVCLSMIMFMFTKAKETSDIVLQSSDITEYMDYTKSTEIVGGVSTNGEERIVGLETIIPTLYKYYKENYTVIFLDSNKQPLELYKTQTNTSLWSNNYTNKYYTNNKDVKICSFDVDEETSRHEPWTGSNQKMKENLDHFLKGGSYSYSSSWANGGEITYNYGNGFIKKYSNSQFRESLGEYTFNQITEDNSESQDNRVTNVKGKKKRVIVYTLIQ